MRVISCFTAFIAFGLEFGHFLVFFFLGFITGLALVDCSASSETIGVLKRVVDLGCCIVMANKKPLTSTMVIKISGFVRLKLLYFF
jgi:hypothetical protein